MNIISVHKCDDSKNVVYNMYIGKFVSWNEIFGLLFCENYCSVIINQRKPKWINYVSRLNDNKTHITESIIIITTIQQNKLTLIVKTVNYDTIFGINCVINSNKKIICIQSPELVGIWINSVLQ